jgi:ribosomal protein L11 methyltransferase
MAFRRDACERDAMSTVTLRVSTSKKLAPLVSEALFAAGAQGLEERPGRAVELLTYGASRAELNALWKRAERLLRGADPMPSAVVEAADDSWKTAWTSSLRPVALTQRLILAPTTAEPPVLTRSQRLIVYGPALAFGDGDHATTRLAARAIEQHYRATPGGALLDIGAGTGVLSFVAVLSGARRALGTDIDPEAVLAAQHNAALNRLQRRTRFVHSSARISGRFDLAVVNIELRPLLEVLADLPAAARRTSRLLVTGFLTSQVAEVAAALKSAGFSARRRAQEQDWVLMEGWRA